MAGLLLVLVGVVPGCSLVGDHPTGRSTAHPTGAAVTRGSTAEAVADDQNYPPSRLALLRRQAQRLLDARARAVRRDDVRVFMASVGPDPRLRARQRTYFHNLTQLPLEVFRWRVEPDVWPARYFADDRYRDTAYLPFVDTSLQLRGFDRRPVVDQVGLTFAPDEEGRLELVGDRDVADQLADGAQERPWDLVRLVVRRSGPLLLLLDRGSAPRAAEITDAVRSAARTVRRVVPSRWDGHVVAYATASRRVITSVDDVPGGSVRRVGALAFGVPSHDHGGAIASFRFLLNPAALSAEEPGLTRLVTHEMTHVALGTHDDDVPTWLTEGVAEWVSVQGLPPSQTFMPRPVVRRAQTQTEVSMPTSAGFNGTDQTWNYGVAWYACEYVTDTFGDARLFTLLRRLEKTEHAAARRGDVAGGLRVETVMRRTVGVGTDELARRAVEKIVDDFT